MAGEAIREDLETLLDSSEPDGRSQPSFSHLARSRMKLMTTAGTKRYFQGTIYYTIKNALKRYEQNNDEIFRLIRKYYNQGNVRTILSHPGKLPILTVVSGCWQTPSR